MTSELLKGRVLRKSTAPATLVAPKKQKLNIVEVRHGYTDIEVSVLSGRQIKP